MSLQKYWKKKGFEPFQILGNEDIFGKLKCLDVFPRDFIEAYFTICFCGKIWRRCVLKTNSETENVFTLRIQNFTTIWENVMRFYRNISKSFLFYSLKSDKVFYVWKERMMTLKSKSVLLYNNLYNVENSIITPIQDNDGYSCACTSLFHKWLIELNTELVLTKTENHYIEVDITCILSSLLLFYYYYENN